MGLTTVSSFPKRVPGVSELSSVPRKYALASVTKKHVVLSDWDDTLIKSHELYNDICDATYKIMQEKYGCSIPTKKYKDKLPKQTPDEFFSEVYGEELGKVATRERANLRKENRLIPDMKDGAIDLVLKCFRENVPFAVVSDTPQKLLGEDLLGTMVRRTLKERVPDLPQEYIDTLPCIGRSNEVPRKPNPAGIKKALEVLDDRFKLQGKYSALMLGDKAAKDGGASKQAGISYAIIPDPRSDNMEGFTKVPGLSSILKLLDHKISIDDMHTPQYTQRTSYNDTPSEETEVVCSDKNDLQIRTSDVLSKEFNDQVVQDNFTDEMKNKIREKLRKSIVEAQEEGVHPVMIHFPLRHKEGNGLSAAYNDAVIDVIEDLCDGVNVQIAHEVKSLTNMSVRKQALQIDNVSEDTQIIAISEYDADQDAQTGQLTGDAIDGLSKKSIFDCADYQKGDIVILADGHVHSGEEFTTLWHALKEKGVKVPIMTALTAMPESQNLQPPKFVLEDIQQALRWSTANISDQEYDSDGFKTLLSGNQAKLEEGLKLVGLSFDTLSNRESLTVMALLINGQDKEQYDWFIEKAEQYGLSSDLNEAIVNQAQKDTMSAGDLYVALYKTIPHFVPKLY